MSLANKPRKRVSLANKLPKELFRKESQMRDYVKTLEAIEQDLPEGIEATHGDFVAYWNNRLDFIIANPVK